MSRRDKEADARREGMSFCMRYLESHNNDVEALKTEIQARGAYNIPLTVDKKDVDDFSKKVKVNTVHSILAMSLLVLNDEFDFKPEDLNRFKDRFNEKAECVIDDYTTWEETIGILRDECGVVVDADFV